MFHFGKVKCFSITEIIWKDKNDTGFYCKFLSFSYFLLLLFCFIVFNNSTEWQMCEKEKEN